MEIIEENFSRRQLLVTTLMKRFATNLFQAIKHFFFYALDTKLLARRRPGTEISASLYIYR